MWTPFKTGASVAETNIDRTTFTLGSGRRVFAMVGEVGSAQLADLSPYSLHMNPGDVLTVTASSPSANATVSADLNWKEEF